MSSSSTKLSDVLHAIDQVLQFSEEESPSDFMARLPEYNRVLQLVRDYLQRSPSPSPVITLPPKFTYRDKGQLPTPPAIKELIKTEKKIPPPLPLVAGTNEDLLQKRQELLQEIEKLEKQHHEKWAIAQQYSHQQKVIEDFCQALLPVVQANLNNYFSFWHSYGQSNVTQINKFVDNEQIDEHHHINTSRLTFPSTDHSPQTNQDFLENTLLFHSQINDSSSFMPLVEDEQSNDQSGEMMPYPGYEYGSKGNLSADQTISQLTDHFASKYTDSPETVLVSLPSVDRVITPDFKTLDDLSDNADSADNADNINNVDDIDDFDVTSMGDLAPSIDTHPYKVASPDENLLPNVNLMQLVPNLELFLDIEIVESLQKELDLLENLNHLQNSEETIIQNVGTWLDSSKVNVQSILNSSDPADLDQINPFDTEDFEENLPSLLGLLREMQEVDQFEYSTGKTDRSEINTTLSDVIASFHSENSILQDNLELGDLLDLMTENSKWLRAGHQIGEAHPTAEGKNTYSEQIFSNVNNVNDINSTLHTTTQPINIINSPYTSDWYLGIDFGTTGISASLLHKQSGEIYPLSWQVIATRSLDDNQDNQDDQIEHQISETGEEITSIIDRLPCQVYFGKKVNSSRTKLQNFKTCLQITLPYTQVDVKRQKTSVSSESFVSPTGLAATTQHEPILQWSPQQEISLDTIKQSLIVLLGNLRPTNDSLSFNLSATQQSVITLSNYYKCGAIGLDIHTFHTALQELQGVIMGCPAGWSAAYRYNLREAVLNAGLVNNITQVTIIEDAIATTLSVLTEAAKTGQTWRAGRTLIINLGASTTEIALVNLPANPQQINYSDFICRTFAYGGNALDQDIICQLLLPSNHQQSFPQVGHPDLGIRYQLQQWLNNSPVRQSLWEAAGKLKVILPTEDNFTLQFADQVWHIDRQNLEKSVLIPYLQELNRQLNNLLAEFGVSAVGINQAICSGGGSQWGAIARWLRQKLPNAVLTIDRETEIAHRVANGLACLPLYPQLFANPQQLYSDYFILWELLRILPEQPVDINEIYRLLENRGINTQTCQGLIQEILDGHLPVGLIPTASDLAWLTPASQNNPDYQRAIASPLFIKGDYQKYDINLEQAHQVIDYLTKLVAQGRQKLDEPF